MLACFQTSHLRLSYTQFLGKLGLRQMTVNPIAYDGERNRSGQRGSFSVGAKLRIIPQLLLTHLLNATYL